MTECASGDCACYDAELAVLTSEIAVATAAVAVEQAALMGYQTSYYAILGLKYQYGCGMMGAAAPGAEAAPAAAKPSTLTEEELKELSTMPPDLEAALAARRLRIAALRARIAGDKLKE